MYWPDQPWALHAGDWEVYGKLALIAGNQDEVLVLGEARPPPPDGQQWSDLYYDYGVNDWMVSATQPVSEGERYLLSAGQDILLRELIERTLKSGLEGTSNLIFRADGRLIAHPRYMEAIQAQSGALSIQEAGDPHLERIMALAQQRPADQVIVANPADKEFLAVTQLSGPAWYLVTLFPQSIVTAGAFETARLILLLGAVALLLELGILFWVMRRQVAEPLERLIAATREVASGRLRSRLEVERDDEIGQLARAFNAMAGEIDAREAALGERSASLAEVNRQLRASSRSASASSRRSPASARPCIRARSSTRWARCWPGSRTSSTTRSRSWWAARSSSRRTSRAPRRRAPSPVCAPRPSVRPDRQDLPRHGAPAGAVAPGGAHRGRDPHHPRGGRLQFETRRRRADPRSRGGAARDRRRPASADPGVHQPAGQRRSGPRRCPAPRRIALPPASTRLRGGWSARSRTTVPAFRPRSPRGFSSPSSPPRPRVRAPGSASRSAAA